MKLKIIPNQDFVEGEPEAKHGYWREDAPREAVDYVLNAPIGGSNGRSDWIWIRLPNGDLVLATYPQGDTYFGTEHWRSI